MQRAAGYKSTMLAGPPEPVQLTPSLTVEAAFPTSDELACVPIRYLLNQVIVVFVYLQTSANSSVSERLRCVVLLRSTDEASERRVLRLAYFSEIKRTRLIDEEHLSHFSTLAEKKSCLANVVQPVCG